MYISVGILLPDTFVLVLCHNTFHSAAAVVMPPAARSRGFCGTFYGDEATMAEKFADWTDGDPPRATTCIFGRETCPTTQRAHLQWYVEFRQPCTLAWVIGQNLGHTEARKGTPKQAYDYCTKDNAYVLFGKEPAGQGARKDIDLIADILTGGGTAEDVARQHPASFIRLHRGIEALQARLRPVSVPRPDTSGPPPRRVVPSYTPFSGQALQEALPGRSPPRGQGFMGGYGHRQELVSPHRSRPRRLDLDPVDGQVVRRIRGPGSRDSRGVPWSTPVWNAPLSPRSVLDACSQEGLEPAMDTDSYLDYFARSAF